MIRKHTLKYLGVKRGHLYNLSQMFQKIEGERERGRKLCKGCTRFPYTTLQFSCEFEIVLQTSKIFPPLERG